MEVVLVHSTNTDNFFLCTYGASKLIIRFVNVGDIGLTEFTNNRAYCSLYSNSIKIQEAEITVPLILLT